MSNSYDSDIFRRLARSAYAARIGERNEGSHVTSVGNILLVIGLACFRIPNGWNMQKKIHLRQNYNL